MSVWWVLYADTRTVNSNSNTSSDLPRPLGRCPGVATSRCSLAACLASRTTADSRRCTRSTARTGLYGSSLCAPPTPAGTSVRSAPRPPSRTKSTWTWSVCTGIESSVMGFGASPCLDPWQTSLRRVPCTRVLDVLVVLHNVQSFQERCYVLETSVLSKVDSVKELATCAQVDMNTWVQ